MRRVLVPALAVSLASGAAVPAAQAAPSTTVVCATDPGATPPFRYLSAPRSCDFVAQGEAPTAGNRLKLRSVRWAGWGRTTASGTGTVLRGGGSRARATIRLSGRVTCGDGGDRFYTRGRLVYRDDALQRRLRPAAFRLVACAG